MKLLSFGPIPLLNHSALVSGGPVVEPSGTPVIALQRLRLVVLVPAGEGWESTCKKAPEEVQGDRGRGDVDHHDQEGVGDQGGGHDGFNR